MRILCTADWHLGRTLEGRDRIPEQVDFLKELIGICDGESVDLVMVAGDVFDTYNPPAAAEQLFYDAVSRLADGGRRAVVVIAGNHDAPDRLTAAGPLASVHGVTLVGTPGAPIGTESPSLIGQAPGIGRAYRRDAGPSWMNLCIPGVGHDVVLAAVPYPSEARLKEALPDVGDDNGFQQAYADRIRRLMESLSGLFRPDAVNLAMSHFYSAGGSGTDSERPIELGGVCAVPADALPKGAHFIGLGHLHRPQTVSGAPAPCMYPGSPLCYGFSEAGQEKSVILVDAVPGKGADIRRIPLSSGKPLVRLRATDGLGHAHSLLADAGGNTWIDIELHMESFPTHVDIQGLREAHPGIITIRPVITGTTEAPDRRVLKGMALEDIFRLFVTAKGGGEPDPRLVALFMETAAEETGADPGGDLEPVIVNVGGGEAV